MYPNHTVIYVVVDRIEDQAEHMVQRLKEESWLTWEVQLINDDGKVIRTWSLDDEDNSTFYWLLELEGYAWNSQVRDNTDVRSHKLYNLIDSQPK